MVATHVGQPKILARLPVVIGCYLSSMTTRSLPSRYDSVKQVQTQQKRTRLCRCETSSKALAYNPMLLV